MDSTALALLLTRYGRRISPLPSITWIHINHGWRGAESDADQAWVEALARMQGVECLSFRLGPTPSRGSPEQVARDQRSEIFERLALERGARVLTAHHADDLAETLLWRVFTGAAETHGEGIRREQGCQLRPLLAVRKADLQAFLEEEEQDWREDRTNHEGELLRTRMRRELMPAIERIFPRAVENLTGYVQGRAGVPSGDAPELGAIEKLLGERGVRMRRAHWREALRSGQAALPEGWTLMRIPGGWNLTQTDPTPSAK
jgi:tRNA(Ile)-lysidine synthase